ncbi:MAG: restriction endonuclease [Gammaproteobacteria bacterium]|nr:restriction endonuclease [Gammaproteobacteria bacterium]
MFRVAISLPDAYVAALDSMTRQAPCSRSEIVRRAIKQIFEDFEDLSIADRRLQNLKDPVLSWGETKNEFLKLTRMVMKMEWQSYEKLVKDIYQELGKAAGVKIECWGPACRAQGKSGEYHQIDVLTSHDDGIHTYKTAIECKYWNKKVSKRSILELSSMLQDTGIEKGVLISKSGFTNSAKMVAKLNNVSLIHLKNQKILIGMDISKIFL